ncbi:MAG: glycosyltransferase family 4 protein [Candidatus Heimdallarchaeota archaeon]|nr:glycosyltransferase family 4 protein [Candidatus Heimdallarchaeota archaeon]MCK5048945.1 glycosyltransferase family 4 protein [Candidatus Heimdallarchaeota archaeon]
MAREKLDYDVLDMNIFPHVIPWIVNKKLKSTKSYITVHEVWGNYWEKYPAYISLLGKRMEKQVLEGRSGLIFVSEWMQERSRQIIPRMNPNSEVIPNGVDTSFFYPREEKEEEKILYVGRLIPYKRVELLLETMKWLTKKRPGITLKIIGEGPSREKIKQIIKELGLKEKVELEHNITDEKLREEYQKAKILVQPSEREGQSIVALEAMASGTPVISVESKWSALEKIIKGKRIGEVAKAKRKELGIKIDQLIEDEEKYRTYQKKGIKHAKEHDWKKITQKIEQKFKE